LTRWRKLVGNYRNAGSDWQPKGDPKRVKVHDFEDKKLGKVAPYSVYDIAADAGWISPRHHMRHGRVRGRLHSHLARKDRQGALSEDGRADDHGRLRRLERLTCAALEWRPLTDVHEQIRPASVYSSPLKA
jgi:hypothetical protein